MRAISAIVAAFVLSISVLPEPANALCVARKHLSGEWKGSDSAKYTLAQYGKHLWWVGDGDGFQNVFSGVINGNIIDGNWADIRHRFTHGRGTLRLEIVRTPGGGIGHLKRLSNAGSGFAAVRWTYSCNDT